jgi:hypothetical protein
VDAAELLQLSYRQRKRWWRRYQQVGGKGLKHEMRVESRIAAKRRSFGGKSWVW